MLLRRIQILQYVPWRIVTIFWGWGADCLIWLYLRRIVIWHGGMLAFHSIVFAECMSKMSSSHVYPCVNSQRVRWSFTKEVCIYSSTFHKNSLSSVCFPFLSTAISKLFLQLLGIYCWLCSSLIGRKAFNEMKMGYTCGLCFYLFSCFVWVYVKSKEISLETIFINAT